MPEPAGSEAPQSVAPQPSPSLPPAPPVAPTNGSIPPPPMRPPLAPPSPGGEAGFLRSLFDLSFASDRVVTVSFARLIYLIAAIASVLVWLVGAVLLFIIGSTASDFFTVWGTLHLIFGWIGALGSVIVVRVLLEVMIAQIRTSQHTAKLVRMTQTSGGAGCSMPEVKA